MSEAGGIVSKCPACGAYLFVRDDQIGRRVRCNKCQHAFTATGSAPTIIQSVGDSPEPTETAKDANEPAPSNLRRAKAVAKFKRDADVVFQALVQSVRGFGCDILEFDPKRGHVRFAFKVNGAETQHDAFVFDVGGRSEVEIVSRELATDEKVLNQHYDAILAELEKYVLFAERQPARKEEKEEERSYNGSRRALAERDYDDRQGDYRPIRRRKKSGSDALAVAGFVCGIVGLVLLCVPAVSMILSVLGIVFGACGMGSRNNGLAVAGLVLGIVTIGIAIVVAVVVAHSWWLAFR